MIRGHDRQVEQFTEALNLKRLHHAWLLAGPKGVGKAHFAREAATRILAEAAGPDFAAAGLQTPADHPIARLVAAGSHPDLRWIKRLEKDKGDGLARNITVQQVREMGAFLNLTPSLSPWRAIVIDSVDDLEGSAANALLKMLEEPPPKAVVFLVSHVPGRLLPTIRSRCRRLEFQALGDDAMTAILESQLAHLPEDDRQRLAALAGGSAGKAMALAELDLVPLEESAAAILRNGDPTNELRSKLATELGRKTAADRYQAFLDLAPALLAREARERQGQALSRTLDAYEAARRLAAIAPRVSLDPAATVFQMGGILASAGSRTLP